MSAPVVAHSVNPYCPASWIHHQLVFLKRYRAIVIAKRTENLAQFPFKPLYAQYDLPWWRRGFEKAVRRWQGYFPQHLWALRHHQAAVLHSHYAEYGMADWRLARTLGIPHLTTFYGADIWKNSRQTEWQQKFREFVGQSQLFLVEGNAMRNKVIALGADPAKVKISHLGVDLSQIQFLPRRPTANGEIRVLMTGRAVEKKGHIYGLKAFAKLAPRYPNLRLDMIIGGGFSQADDHKARLESCIRECGLAERITWSELVSYSEYLQRLRSAHIFLQPSVVAASGDAEGGFPVTLLETAAAGLPIVATRHCDIPEAVLDGRSGLLADERDVEGLARQLKAMICQPESWAAFGEAGRRHVESSYNILHQVELLECYYDALLGRGPLRESPPTG